MLTAATIHWLINEAMFNSGKVSGHSYAEITIVVEVLVFPLHHARYGQDALEMPLYL
jgi:hypothetical protein